jgi:hypothetical protein
MKDFFELREATTGRDGVKCSAEKSQFGGYTALCKRGSKLVYSSQASYKDAATAKKHAEVYADAYYSQGERAADRAVRAFQQKNASKKYVKESVELDEGKEFTFRIHKDGKPLKKGGKTVEVYGIVKAKKMVDDLNKKQRGKFTAHHVYKDGDELDESLSAMIKKKHDKTKKDQADAKKNIALKQRLKKSGIHVKEEELDEVRRGKLKTDDQMKKEKDAKAKAWWDSMDKKNTKKK